MSCTDIRIQIDRQPRVSDAISGRKLERIKAHSKSCVHCAEYLDRAERLEQMLANLPEIEPAPDLSLRVMERLKEQAPEQAPEPEPRPGFFSPLVQQLCKNLSVLLAFVGLLAHIRVAVSAYPLSEIVLSPRIFLGLSGLGPSGQTAVPFAIACLLLLLSIRAGSRPEQIRDQA